MDVIFADAAAIAIALINDRYGSPVAFRSAPRERPDEFVTVQRTGGVRRTLVSDEAQLTIDTWSQTPEGAHDLMQLVRAYLFSATTPGTTTGGVPVYRVVEYGGPADFPDLASETPRYRWTVGVHLRAAQIIP